MDKEGRYTAGPWQTQKSGPYPHAVHVRGPNNEYVAQCIRPEGPPPHSEETIAEANAKLIAAAPEMADLLRELLALLNNVTEPVESHGAIYRAEKLLTKIGETP